MTELVIPAPLWRRLAAAGYDALLLVALLLSSTWFAVLLRDALGVPPQARGWFGLLRLMYFGIGLAFCGGFWTHGGQTLGMRTWRLKVRRDDGSALRWPVAAVRYAVSLLSWGLAGAGLLWCLIDRRRRAWHDIVAGTEVVLLPKPLRKAG